MVEWFQLSDIFVTGYSGSVVVSVKENNIELLRKNSVVTMVAGSFFHDTTNGLLYLWPTDSDNPNSNGKTYVLYVWQGFADSDGVNFAIQGEGTVYYLPGIDSANTPPFSQAINELFTGEITQQFGDIMLNNSEWFFLNKDNYIWQNSTAIVKVGVDEPVYASYVEIFNGQIENINFLETGAMLNLIDKRDRFYNTIPPDRYLKGDFPYIHGDWHYQARAILVGEKEGIQPAYVNTSIYVYEISQVDFEFYTFTGIQSIDAVYKDGVLLATPADYTTDLANGQFTLTASPGSSVITCDAKGLKLGRNFATNTWTDTYSFNISDITYFLLRLQNIDEDDIDETGFLTLQTGMQYITCGDWICQQTEFSEKLKELQTTGKFHLLPAANGTLKMILYEDSTAPTQIVDQCSDPVISMKAENLLSRIWLRYNKTPVLNTTETESLEKLTDFQLVSWNDARVTHKYQIEKSKNFKTIMVNESDASAAAVSFLTLFQRPWETFSCTFTFDAISWDLLSKVSLYYYQILNGSETYIYNGITFIIISKIVNWDGGIQLVLLKDPAVPIGQPLQDHDFIGLQDHALNVLTS